MIDHVSLKVGDLGRSRNLYDQTLVPPGARGIVTVNTFHTSALTAGGRDYGLPGLRLEYHPGYYAALVIDPDGHHIKVVCHEPE